MPLCFIVSLVESTLYASLGAAHNRFKTRIISGLPQTIVGASVPLFFSRAHAHNGILVYPATDLSIGHRQSLPRTIDRTPAARLCRTPKLRRPL